MSRYTVDEVADYLSSGYWGWRMPVNLGNPITVNLSSLTSANEYLARAAISAWAGLGLTFSIVRTNSADIMLGDDASGAYTTWDRYQSTGSGGAYYPSVNIGPDFSKYYGSRFGGYLYQSWVHEIGHALGLGHAGDYNFDGTNGITYGVDNHYDNDSWQISVMSYFSQDENTTIDASFGYVLTPMPADIAAIQKLYDPEVTAGAGNTTYFWDTNASGTHGRIGRMITTGALADHAFTLTIMDGDGVDTLNFRGETDAVTVDLTPGAISSAFGLRGNVIIERDSVIENVEGSGGHDIVKGNAADNRLKGNAGNDRLSGAGGHDRLYGGAGDDQLSGGSGSDRLIGGAGRDQMDGGAGQDTAYFTAAATVDLKSHRANGGEAAGDRLINIENLTGSKASDLLAGNDLVNRLDGGDGNDSLDGRGGDDALSGGHGDDLLTGGDGNDMLQGGAGDDRLSGGAGDDRLTGGAGRDQMDGGAGQDTAYFTAAATVDLKSYRANGGEAAGDRLINIENLTGSTASDLLAGNDLVNQLDGGDGNDSLDGRGGDDALSGGHGDDLLIGGGGNDLLQGGAGHDELRGGAGHDVLIGLNGNDRIIVDEDKDKDSVTGGVGIDEFVFRGGRMIISDFTDNRDVLMLDRDALGLAATATLEDVFDNARQLHGDTLLEFGTGCYVRVVGLTNIDPLADDVILI